MPESEQRPTVPWPDRILLSVLFVAVIVAASYVTIVVVGGRVLPAPLNDLIFMALGTLIISATVLRVGDRIIRRLDQIDWARRAERPGEITRDLSRSRVVASVPAVVGLDSGVVEIGSRIARRLEER